MITKGYELNPFMPGYLIDKLASFRSLFTLLQVTLHKFAEYLKKR